MIIGKNSFISNKTKVIFPENLVIGNNCRIDDNCILICKKKIIIGNYVHVAPNSIIRAHKEIFISDFTLISSFCDIYTSIDNIGTGKDISHPLFKKNNKHNKPNSSSLKIGKYCQLGSHSVVLPGAELSEGSIVGGLTLINFKTKKWHVYLGNPARLMGVRDKSKVIKFFSN